MRTNSRSAPRRRRPGDQGRSPVEGGEGPRRGPAQRPAGRGGHAEGDLGQPPGRGGDQGDADDPVAEQLRVLLGQRHDRHAAHRVADEHDRPGGRGGLEHGEQVVAELVDRGVLDRAAAGAAVAALVPEHQAAQVGQVAPLVVPAVLVEGQAVAEHDRDRRLRLAPCAGRGAGRRPRRAGRRRRRRSPGRRCRAARRTARRPRGRPRCGTSGRRRSARRPGRPRHRPRRPRRRRRRRPPGGPRWAGWTGVPPSPRPLRRRPST